MLNLLAHRYKRLDLPSRRLDGYKETELVKFCYETEIDDWSSFEELQGQVFEKFLAANMKSNTPACQSENDQRRVKVSSMERVFKISNRNLATECEQPRLSSKQSTASARNQAARFFPIPPPSHPTKEATIFTRYFNSSPSSTASSPVKKISDSSSLKARKWLSNSLTRLFGPLQKKKALQDAKASSERFSKKVVSDEDEFCWQEAIDHSLSQLRDLAAIETISQNIPTTNVSQCKLHLTLNFMAFVNCNIWWVSFWTNDIFFRTST